MQKACYINLIKDLYVITYCVHRRVLKAYPHKIKGRNNKELVMRRMHHSSMHSTSDKNIFPCQKY